MSERHFARDRAPLSDMINNLSRRQFLQSSGLLAGSLCLTGWRSRPAPRVRSANDRLNLGIVGVAGYGQTQLEECVQENIVALCDVDTLALEQASQRHPKASVYADFRRMLDREALDGVIVATPDHTHAIVAAYSLQAGLHVYCADPLTHRISEARWLAQLARRRRRVTQLGGALNTPATEDRVLAILRSGELGPVREVQIWTDRSHGELSHPSPIAPAPRHLDYDLWLGPLFPRPFCGDFLPGRWRHWWNFGGGTLAEAASPFFSMLYRGLGLESPARVEASGPALHLQHTPAWLQVKWTYVPKEPLTPVEVFWNHGSGGQSRSDLPARIQYREGMLFVGTSGQLFLGANDARLFPEGAPTRDLRAEASSGNRPSRLCEWLEACRSQSLTTQPFEQAAPFTEALLLGNVAYRTDRRLVWNPRKMVASNLPEASEFIQHSYRPGWWV